MLRHAVVTFLAIFFAELPDKTMFATLLLSTRFKRKLPVWIGVSSGYGLHVVIAVLLGSALSNLPERPIHLAIGALFTVGGIITWRSGVDDDDDVRETATARTFMSIAWTAASVIAVAEFADLTQLATAGFAARFSDPVGVGLGAFLALSSVSGCAVLLGSWLQRVVPLRLIQKVAAVLFLTIGIVTIVGAI
ncbi:MAG: TMEM165/GDT1 family protein, partial [Gammaproteobacteria bacterium]|nr:TMEM165/GDT1 family protein [Gammaproteobacteria bacterium]